MGRFLVVAALAFAALFAVNASFFAPRADGPRTYLAHRGVHQQIDRTRPIGRDACTAGLIAPPAHDFIENTLPSMAEAFRRGASIVEIDIHPTTDGRFVVFHDWRLECRTDGEGVVRERDLAFLQSLDVGYGYTADGGASFPLRGKGVGLAPSLEETLAAFPDRRFLIHIKSDDPAEGDALAGYLETLPAERLLLLAVYGGERPVERVAARLPAIKAMTKARAKRCLTRYLAYGWTGLTPRACRGGLMIAPVNYAPWLWGWPRRFEARMRAAGTEIFISGPLSGDASAGGLNTPEDLSRLPSDWRGGVWTDAIETINPSTER